MSSSIIIIGAGAAGLQAGRRLSAAGYKVILLEASVAPGGRIFPLTAKGFSMPVEGGAEFIHGDLPVTLGLAAEAGVVLQPVRALMTRRMDGNGSSGEDWEGFMGKEWGELMQRMEELTADLPIADFMAEHFNDERYARLRESVRRFAEGYDLADLRRVSIRGLYLEWSREGEEEEYRPVGGYGRIIDFLVTECRRNGTELYFSSPVTDVTWNKGRVEVWTMGGRVYGADTLIVSVSLGVLAADLVRFSPVLPGVLEAVKELGHGSVIKILLEVKEAFWLKHKSKDRTLFVLSEQPVPTWWTQAGDESLLFTGWLSGEGMIRFLQLDESGRLDSCMQSLAAIFTVDAGWLRQQLAASQVLDWAGAPFVRGGYSFETVEAAGARGLASPGLRQTTSFFRGALSRRGAP